MPEIQNYNYGMHAQGKNSSLTALLSSMVIPNKWNLNLHIHWLADERETDRKRNLVWHDGRDYHAVHQLPDVVILAPKLS